MLIEKPRWTDYLAELSRQAEGYETSIEILSVDLGDQVEARHAVLHEIAYDAHEGIAVSVAATLDLPVTLRHVVAAPARLEATDEPGVPAALAIDGLDGTRTLIRLAAPPAAG